MRKLPWAIFCAVVAWWALNGLISAVQLSATLTAMGREYTTRALLSSELGNAGLWIPCTFWLLWLVKRRPISKGDWKLNALLLLAATLMVGLFRALSLHALYPYVGWYNRPIDWGSVLLGSALKEALRACLVVGVAHAVVYARRSGVEQRRAQQLEEQLTQARLEALSAQLNPHFLFNALNSIAEMVHHDADAADSMLVQLGALLRHSLESTRQQFTTVSEELEIIRCFIGIEQVRLGERLSYRNEIAFDVLDAQLPRFLLQPLVENAVTHAVSARTTKSQIEVLAQREEDALVLIVRDDGGGGAHPKQGFGIGLSNTRARLRHLHGEQQSIVVVPRTGGGTEVRVSLPYIRCWR